MLCDQPFVDGHLLHQMIETQLSSGKSIVACAYKDTLGAPVLLDKKYIPHLLKLKGGEGAKKILFENPNEVAELPFPLGHIDIDTPDDLEALKKG
jgi:molybdenum cofactor cytidylyltransferase